MGTLTYSTQEVQAKLDSINQIDAKFGTYPRPNLLDNWYFGGGGSQQGGGQLPINTRGQTSYSGIGYTFDRWKATGGDTTVAIGSDGVTLTCPTRYAGIYQYFEQPPTGKQCALSILSTEGLSWQVFTFGTATVVYLTDYYVEIGTNYVAVLRRVTGSASLKIHALKLELGSTQTLAHQENGVWVLNEIPNYQQEMEKCQRHQIELVPPGNSAIGCIGGGTPTSSTQCYVFVPTPTELRTVPTLSYAGTWKLVREGTAPASGASVSAMSVVNRSTNGVTLQITSSGLSTSYRYDLWYTAADATNKLLLSANL